jgi:hypothetical protein
VKLMIMVKRFQKCAAGMLCCCVLTLVAVIPIAASETAGSSSSAQIGGPLRRIIDALVSAGLAVSAHQIEMLSGAGNAIGNASVRVVSISGGAGGTTKVKLRCQDNHECLPFYVLVHGIDSVKVTNAAAIAEPLVDSIRPQDIIRGGDRAILILETADSRMRFPVICLQSGAPGQRIKVTSADRKRSYDAEIVAPGLLKGIL